MSNLPINIDECSLEMQRLLYACAFWVASADGDFSPQEVAWLCKQFGASFAREQWKHFCSLSEDEYFSEYDNLTDAVSDDEKSRIYPGLKDWLYDLAMADNVYAPRERVVIGLLLRQMGVPVKREAVIKLRSDRKQTHIIVPSSLGPMAEARHLRFKKRVQMSRYAPTGATLAISMSALLIGMLMSVTAAFFVSIGAVVSSLLVFITRYFKECRYAFGHCLFQLTAVLILHSLAAVLSLVFLVQLLGFVYLPGLGIVTGSLWLMLIVSLPFLHSHVKKSFELAREEELIAKGYEAHLSEVKQVKYGAVTYSGEFKRWTLPSATVGTPSETRGPQSKGRGDIWH